MPPYVATRLVIPGQPVRTQFQKQCYTCTQVTKARSGPVEVEIRLCRNQVRAMIYVLALWLPRTTTKSQQ